MAPRGDQSTVWSVTFLSGPPHAPRTPPPSEPRDSVSTLALARGLSSPHHLHPSEPDGIHAGSRPLLSTARSVIVLPTRVSARAPGQWLVSSAGAAPLAVSLALGVFPESFFLVIGEFAPRPPTRRRQSLATMQRGLASSPIFEASLSPTDRRPAPPAADSRFETFSTRRPRCPLGSTPMVSDSHERASIIPRDRRTSSVDPKAGGRGRRIA